VGRLRPSLPPSSPFSIFIPPLINPFHLPSLLFFFGHVYNLYRILQCARDGDLSRLQEALADPSLDRSLLRPVLSNHKGPCGEGLLLTAAYNGHMEVLKLLIQEFKLDINARVRREEAFTPFLF
jgi:hypothetical protein